VAKELSRYNIDKAVLSETRLALYDSAWLIKATHMLATTNLYCSLAKISKES
jgi:hypothetical protein